MLTHGSHVLNGGLRRSLTWLVRLVAAVGILSSTALALTSRPAAAAVLNDAMASPTAIRGMSEVGFPDVVSGSSAGASKEAGEPNHAGQLGGASVWYSWFPYRGDWTITFDTVGSTFDTVLAVYQREGSRLVPVVSDDDSAGGGASRVSFLAGYREYLVAVDGVAGASGAFQLRWFLTPPANDSFAAPTDLTGPSGEVKQSNTGATVETGEPNHNGAGASPPVASVWYRWTAPATGRYAFDASHSTPLSAPGNASSFLPVLVAYTGSAVTSLTRTSNLVGGDTISLEATAGTEYRMVVAGNPQFGAHGNVVLRWAAPPPNDDFAQSQVLTGTSGTTAGTTLASSSEPGEPNPFTDNSSSGGHTVWFTWTAPAAGSVTFDTAGSETAQLAVYEGSTLAGLTLRASSTTSNSGPIALAAPAGTTYRIQLAGRSGRTGNYKLTWTLGAPGNDAMAKATAIRGMSEVGYPDVVSGSSLGATKEAGEPNHAGEAGGASVWFSWFPYRANWSITFDTVGSSFDTVLAVYQRDFGGPLVPVASDNDSAGGGASRVTFLAGYREYLVAVDGVGAASGGLQLRWFLTPPANDSFAAATELPGPSGELKQSNAGATLEAGEPNHYGSGVPPTASVWYRWTAPTTGRYAFDASHSTPIGGSGNASNFLPVLVAYSGSSVTSLTRADELVGGDTVTLDATAGTEYRLVVAGNPQHGAHGNVVLRWGAPPANDNFADARALAGTSGSTAGTTLASSSEPGEPNPFTDNSASGGQTVWFTYTAPAGGSITFDTAGSEVAQIAVYEGDTLTGLTLRANHTSANSGPLNLAAPAGTTYRIQLAGRNGRTGNYKLTWNLGTPTNDAMSKATTIRGMSEVSHPDVLSGSSLGATKEAGEPHHAGQPGGASVWYSWFPYRGDWTMTFDTVGSSFDTVLAVYTRDFGGQLVPVVADDNSGGGGASKVSFLAGYREYLIAVDGVGGASGPLQLRWFLTPPDNDSFVAPTDLTGPSGELEQSNTGATLESGEPNHNGSGRQPVASVWYRWTAPATGRYAFDVSHSSPLSSPGNAGFFPTLRAYTGTTLTSLTPTSTSLGSTTVTLDASAGTEYRLAVAGDSFHGAHGNIDLRWGPPPPNDQFADARILSGTAGTTNGTTLAASREPGEPNPFTDNSASGGHTVWFTWTAPATGSVTFDTAGSESAQMAVYEGDTLSALTLRANHTFSNTAPISLAAPAGTTYRIQLAGRSGRTGSYELSWNLTLAPVQTPAAQDVTAATDEDVPITINLAGSDPGGLPITYTIASPPQHGSLGAVDGNRVVFAPQADFSGAATFTYVVSNGTKTSAPAQVSIDVRPVNDAPVCASDELLLDEDSMELVTPLCSDVDGDQLTYAVTSAPAHGATSVGSFIAYTPEPDYAGPDSLQYAAMDGELQSAPVTLTIAVAPVPDAPDVEDDFATGAEDTVIDVDVLANDDDVDGDALTISSFTQGGQGAVTCSTTSCRYTPAADRHGPDSFSYSVSDGTAVRTAQVALDVVGVNDAPTAAADVASTEAPSAVDIDVLGNDADVDGDQLVIAGWTQPLGGTVTCTATCSYQPSPGFAGPDGFSYSIDDGHGGRATATVSITVTAPSSLHATVQQPIDADGSSVFSTKRGVVPVKFALFDGGAATCSLPPAQIALRRITESGGAVVDEVVYTSPSDTGSSFRRVGCAYIYNVAATNLGVGAYEVGILIDGHIVGSATFKLAR